MRNKMCLEESVSKTSKHNLTSECLGKSQDNVYIAGYRVSGWASSSSSQRCSFSNRFGCNLQKCNEAMRTHDLWVRVIPHPSGAAILDTGVPWALNPSPAWKNETMRMVSISWTISKSGAIVARAHSPSRHPRDSIAIPASLMRGDLFRFCLACVFVTGVRCNRLVSPYPYTCRVCLFA